MNGEDDDLSDIDENDAVHEGDTSDALPEECKMVLGVRMDLKMDKGKIAAQCGHATLDRTDQRCVRVRNMFGHGKS